MTLQHLLLKLHRRGLLPGPGRALMRSRAWTIEGGEAAGLRIVFPQNLDFIAGSSEMPVQRAVLQHLRPGGVFYDIGANVGFFSLLATKGVGPTGSVYAFEPVAENVATIRRNAALNGLANVSVLEVAAGEQAAEAELFVTEWDGGSSLDPGVLKPGEPVHRRPVRVAAVDDLIAAHGLRPPSFIKIDVEGAELPVLRGLAATLAQHRPVLLVEIDDGDRGSFERRRTELDGAVSAHGYEVSHLPDSYPNVNWHVGHSLALPLPKLH